MNANARSTLAIWTACLGIGLLYFARTLRAFNLFPGITDTKGNVGTTPNTIFNIIVSTLDYRMSLPDAIDAPRFSHQWLPDQISFEAPERFPDTVNALRALGHSVTRTGPLPQGDAHSIWVGQNAKYLGVADVRRNGNATVAGY